MAEAKLGGTTESVNSGAGGAVSRSRRYSRTPMLVCASFLAGVVITALVAPSHRGSGGGLDTGGLGLGAGPTQGVNTEAPGAAGPTAPGAASGPTAPGASGAGSAPAGTATAPGPAGNTAKPGA